MSTHTNSSSEKFKKIFGYTEVIRNISESIERLYQLATTPESKEAVADDVAQLIETQNNLFEQQVHFASFMATLNLLEFKVLKLRCEENKVWKEIASELPISASTAKRILAEVAEKAEKYGGIF